MDNKEDWLIDLDAQITEAKLEKESEESGSDYRWFGQDLIDYSLRGVESLNIND